MFTPTVWAPDKLSVPDTVKLSFLSTIDISLILTVGFVLSTINWSVVYCVCWL